jgi:large subunit ribosomal protein L28
MSDTLNQQFKFKVSAHALRSVEHRGGLDAYLMKARDENLSLKARRIKRRLEKAQAAAA